MYLNNNNVKLKVKGYKRMQVRYQNLEEGEVIIQLGEVREDFVDEGFMGFVFVILF